MRKKLLRYALIMVALIIALSQAGCRKSGQDVDQDDKLSRKITNQKNLSVPKSKPKDSTDSYNTLVINDFPVSEDQYIIKTKDEFIYILLDSEIITYTLKVPYATNIYPELSKENGQITMSWENQGETILRVDMVEGSHEAYMNESNEPLDIMVAPETVNGKLFIPINLFTSIFEMKETYDPELDSTFFHFEENFPKDLVVGSWSDHDTDIFTTFEDISTGLESLSSFAVGYQFMKDGTYREILVSVGGFQDAAVQCKGKYKVLGNTLIYYDIYETLYKGRPFKLIHKNKKLDKPSFEFIDNYDPDENKIKINSFWLNKVNP